MTLAAEFNFSRMDHKPENFDLVVNLGKPVLDNKGRDTGKVYVYAASYEEAGWFSSAGVKGQIVTMSKSDLTHADNVINYNRNMLSQVQTHAQRDVNKALAMDGVEPRYTRDDVTGVRLDVNGAFHGVKHERFTIGEDLKRLKGGFEGDLQDKYDSYKEIEDKLQTHADVLDHYKEFMADMNKTLDSSGLAMAHASAGNVLKASVAKP